jgi:hypothetical protein
MDDQRKPSPEGIGRDGPPPPSRAYQDVVEAQRLLRELLQQVEDSLASRTATIGAVSDLLARLGDELIKHFAMEEDGGYFADALLHAPQLVARANELLAQHPKMCGQAKNVSADPHPGSDDAQWWQKTRERFRAFKAELLRHERSEDRLLQEAYLQDLGAND